MTHPVTYLEINSPDLAASSAFFEGAFGWRLQPFAAPDYLVAPGDDRGIDTALLASRDGAPRAIPVIRVPSLGTATARVREHGGTVVVEPFSIAGGGRGWQRLAPDGVAL